MFCHKCGKEFSDDAVVCIHCGVETKNMSKNTNGLVNIVNQSSASASTTTKGSKIVYNGFVDFLMICLTGGLWIFWMIFRPKYC